MRDQFATRLLSRALLLCLLLSFAGTNAQSNTMVNQQLGANNEVQPAPEQIHLTPDVIRSAQQKLNDQGYKSGTVDGKMGPVTAAAVRRYQQDKGLKETGTLDKTTLSHLNVGIGHIMATAPGDIGRGAKAAGHDIKGGHPIAAGKALGKGVGRAAKAVGEGTKSGVSEGAHKVTGQKPEKSASPPPK